MSRSRTKLKGSGTAVQGRDNVAAGAGGVAVGRDIHGNVVVIQPGAGPLDSERFWQALSGQRPAEDLVRATKRYLDYLLDYYRYLELKGMGISDRVPCAFLSWRCTFPSRRAWRRQRGRPGRGIFGLRADRRPARRRKASAAVFPSPSRSLICFAINLPVLASVSGNNDLSGLVHSRVVSVESMGLRCMMIAGLRAPAEPVGSLKRPGNRLAA